MSRKLTALALFMMTACIAVSTQAADVTGWFVNGGVGSAHWRISKQTPTASQGACFLPDTIQEMPPSMALTAR